MISFYKPNSRNQGTACSVRLSDNRAFYFSLVKQFSWDAEKKKGSFRGNLENPKAKVILKLNFIEACGILNAIDKNDKWDVFHSTSAKTQIYFEPYINNNVQMGYSFKVIQTREGSDEKLSFLVGFTMAEVRFLREFLISGLNTTFRRDFENSLTQRKDISTIESNESDPQTSPSEDPFALNKANGPSTEDFTPTPETTEEPW